MPKNCLDLSGKVAVVFGASSGFGKAIALGLAEHGAHVVPTARRYRHVAEKALIERLDRSRETESAENDIARAGIREWPRSRAIGYLEVLPHIRE